MLLAEHTMATFLQDATSFFSWAITSLTSALDTIVASPPLTVLVLLMPVCGFAIGMLTRLIRAN